MLGGANGDLQATRTSNGYRITSEIKKPSPKKGREGYG